MHADVANSTASTTSGTVIAARRCAIGGRCPGGPKNTMKIARKMYTEVTNAVMTPASQRSGPARSADHAPARICSLL